MRRGGRGKEKRMERKGEKEGEEGGEEGKQRMRKERVLYCLYAGVAPTMITNQCHFSQVQAREGKTSHGENQRPSLPFLEKRERAESR